MKISSCFTSRLIAMLIFAVCFSFLTVSCNNDDPDPLRSEADITAFTFSELDPAVSATIDGTEITATVPPGTDLSALTPTITVSEGAAVDPESGVAQNFTSPVTYTVTAEDGTEKIYTVTVNRELRSEADITNFTFSEFDPEVVASIDGTNITATVPSGTDVTSLTPTITVSEGAVVEPESGVAQDFSSPVTYTVTAENGMTQTYTVTVERDPTLVVTPVWQRNYIQGGIPNWFVSHHTRDLATNGDFVYIQNNRQEVRVVSPAEGADVSVGANGFITSSSSGTFPILGTATDSQGRLIGSNLVVNSGSGAFKVYAWANNEADQQLILEYPNPQGFRLGDNITVTGDVNGEGAIFAAVGGGNQILKFNITGGEVNSTPEIITLEGVSLGNSPDVALVSGASNGNILVAGTGVSGVAEFTQNGALVGQLPEHLNDNGTIGGAFFSNASDIEVFEIQGRQVIAATVTDLRENMPGNTGYLYLIDITEGWENVTLNKIERVAFTPESAESDAEVNTNATGGVDVVVNGDQATVYALITNFGIGAYKVTFE